MKFTLVFTVIIFVITGCSSPAQKVFDNSQYWTGQKAASDSDRDYILNLLYRDLVFIRFHVSKNTISDKKIVTQPQWIASQKQDNDVCLRIERSGYGLCDNYASWGFFSKPGGGIDWESVKRVGWALNAELIKSYNSEFEEAKKSANAKDRISVVESFAMKYPGYQVSLRGGERDIIKESLEKNSPLFNKTALKGSESANGDCKQVKQADTVFTEVNKQADKMIKSGNIGSMLYGGTLKVMYGAIPHGIKQGNSNCYPK